MCVTEAGRNGFSEAVVKLGVGHRQFQMPKHNLDSSVGVLPAGTWQRPSTVTFWDKCRLSFISCMVVGGFLLPLTCSGDLLIGLFWIPSSRGKIHLHWAEKSLSWAPHIQGSPRRGWHAVLSGCCICNRIEIPVKLCTSTFLTGSKGWDFRQRATLI